MAGPVSIVVLDGHTLTPAVPGEPPPAGEPGWEPLEALGRLRVFPRTSREERLEHAAGAEVLLTNKVVLDRSTLSELLSLRYVGVVATGTNVVDLEAASERGIVVSNVPAYSTESVAQHVFALLLELLVHTSRHDAAVHAGEWVRSPDFSFRVAPTEELSGKTLGIVGMGTIGRRVAQIGAAFGLGIVAAHQRSMDHIVVPGVAVKWLPLDALFAQCDVLSLHCPLSEATRGLVSRSRLALMKPSAILINTGRGELVDEAALSQALHAGALGGAGLDVLSREPPDADNPLLGAPRCIITPHVAWATRQARARLMRASVENVRAFLAGKPQHVVSGR